MNPTFYFHRPNGAWYRILALDCRWAPREGTILLTQLTPFQGNWDSDRLSDAAAENPVFLTNEVLPFVDCHEDLPPEVKTRIARIIGEDYSTWITDPDADIRSTLDPRLYHEMRPLIQMIDVRQKHRLPEPDPNGLKNLQRFLDQARIPLVHDNEEDESLEEINRAA